jgi:NADH-ubiquinone oxidoreductase chain 5
MAILGGALLRWLIFSFNDVICLPFFIKNLILVTCILGGLFGYFIRKTVLYFTNKSLNTYFFRFINRSIWFIPLISTIGIIFYPLTSGFNVLKSFDQGWSEFFGAQKIYFLIRYFSSLRQTLQNNNLKIYLILFIWWVIFLVLFIII